MRTQVVVQRAWGTGRDRHARSPPRPATDPARNPGQRVVHVEQRQRLDPMYRLGLLPPHLLVRGAPRWRGRRRLWWWVAPTFKCEPGSSSAAPTAVRSSRPLSPFDAGDYTILLVNCQLSTTLRWIKVGPRGKPPPHTVCCYVLVQFLYSSESSVHLLQQRVLHSSPGRRGVARP